MGRPSVNHVRTEESGDLGFACLAGGHRDREIVETALGRSDFDAVEIEKHQSGDGTDPLVAVDERVVLNQVEQVRRGHGEDIPVEQLAAEAHARLGHGGFQQPQITNAAIAAIPRHLVGVQAQHVVDREEVNAHLLGQSLEVVAKPLVDFVQRSLKLPLPLCIADR